MDRLTHEQIWTAIDRLAERTGHSASGLARKAGLDPTTFNKSKRHTGEGRERWPSTESIAKILHCTNTDIHAFMDELEAVPTDTDHPGQPEADNSAYGNISYRDIPASRGVPLIGFAQAGSGGYFDDGGFPVGQGWDQIDPPGDVAEHSYALKVSGDSMMPLYRQGDILVVDPSATVHRGDRVVVKTRDGEVLAKLLEKRSSQAVHLKSINPDHADVVLSETQIDWIARIVWASQ
ncbi:MAG: helix-turn-helix transcriptional regulator [Pseudomonadota bacterium]